MSHRRTRSVDSNSLSTRLVHGHPPLRHDDCAGESFNQADYAAGSSEANSVHQPEMLLTFPTHFSPPSSSARPAAVTIQASPESPPYVPIAGTRKRQRIVLEDAFQFLSLQRADPPTNDSTTAPPLPLATSSEAEIESDANEMAAHSSPSHSDLSLDISQTDNDADNVSSLNDLEDDDSDSEPSPDQKALYKILFASNSNNNNANRPITDPIDAKIEDMIRQSRIRAMFQKSERVFPQKEEESDDGDELSISTIPEISPPRATRSTTPRKKSALPTDTIALLTCDDFNIPVFSSNRAAGIDTIIRPPSTTTPHSVRSRDQTPLHENCSNDDTMMAITSEGNDRGDTRNKHDGSIRRSQSLPKDLMMYSDDAHCSNSDVEMAS